MTDKLFFFIRSIIQEGRRPKLHWSKVDWSQATSVIAQQTGTNVGTVSIQRRKHAPETVGRSFVGKTPKRTFHDWGNVDWSKPSSVIAREFGTDPSHVSKARMKHAPETVNQTRTAHKGIDWSTVDWSRSSADIARRLGVEHSTVVIQRQRYAHETVGKRTRLVVSIFKSTKEMLEAEADRQGSSVDELLEKIIMAEIKERPQDD